MQEKQSSPENTKIKGLPISISKITNINDTIDVLILDIDDERKRINCSLKQMKDNPWVKLRENFNINDTFETEIVNIVDFGIFVKILKKLSVV